jgi:hypothetical protein
MQSYSFLFLVLCFITTFTGISFSQIHLWETIPTGNSRNCLQIGTLSDSVFAVSCDSGSFIRYSIPQNQAQIKQLPVLSPVVSIEKVRFSSNSWKNFILTKGGNIYALQDGSAGFIEDTLPATVPSELNFRKLRNFNIAGYNEIRYGIIHGNGQLLGYKHPYTTPRFDVVFSTLKPIEDVYPFNSWNILAIGDSGKIWKTVGLADPFQLVNHNLTTHKLNRVFGKKDARIWIAGDSGTVLFSANSGQTWIKIQVPTSANLNSGSVSDSIVWLCGDNGVLLYSKDEGVSWSTDNSNTSNNLNDILAAGPWVFAVGDGGVIRKLDLLTTGMKSKIQTSATISVKENEVTIQNPDERPTRIQIWNSEGRKVFNRKLEGNSSVQQRISGKGLCIFQQIPESGIPITKKLILFP